MGNADFFGWLPHANEIFPGAKPIKRSEGVYHFLRQPWDTEILLVEPIDEQGMRKSYWMYPGELKHFLTRVLEVPDGRAEKVMDLVWDLRKISLNTVTGMALILRDKDVYGDLD